MALLGRVAGFLDKYLFGYALGVASGPALEPFVQPLANEAWTLNPDKPPDPYFIAQGVAQKQVDAGQAKTWALQVGLGDAQWNALLAAADTGPGVAMAYEMRRRGRIGDAEFRTALKREAIEDQWVGPLSDLLRVLLSPAELANAVVQGHRSFADALADAELQGYTQQDFQTMVDNTGLPPGPETLLDWLRRGVTDPGGVTTGILEGHTKPKYTAPYLQTRYHVLTAAEYVNAAIRGWITQPEMIAGGDLTGWDADAMDLKFKIHGRPATTHQVHVGFARGGRNASIGNDERETFRKAVLESDIRLEWEPILWAQRYTYPAAFVLRALTQGGDITEAQAHEILLFEGWEPTLAAQVAKSWAGGTGATGAVDPNVKKAQTALYTALHRSYVARESDSGAVTPGLTSLGVSGQAQTDVLALWDIERALIHAQLSPTQIRKAVNDAVVNPATGQPWTHADALAAMLARGYSQADAETFLAE